MNTFPSRLRGPLFDTTRRERRWQCAARPASHILCPFPSYRAMSEAPPRAGPCRHWSLKHRSPSSSRNVRTSWAASSISGHARPPAGSRSRVIRTGVSMLRVVAFQVAMPPDRRTASFVPLTDLRVAARMRLYVQPWRIGVPGPLHFRKASNELGMSSKATGRW